MKKLIVVFMLSFMILFLGACEEVEPEENTTEEVVAIEESQPPVEEVVDVEDNNEEEVEEELLKELIYENGSVQVIQYVDTEICEVTPYTFKHVLFESTTCGEFGFIGMGYFAMIDGEERTVEETVELGLLSELEITTFVSTPGRDDRISVYAGLPDETYDAIQFLFVYEDISIYSTSIESSVMDFFDEDNVVGHTKPNDYTMFALSPSLPILYVYNEGVKQYRYVGEEIIEFIGEYQTCLDSTNTVTECDTVVNGEGYIHRWGHINGYDIVSHTEGPAAYASIEYEYMGATIYANVQFGPGGKRMATTGIWAYKDGVYIEIEGLIEDGKMTIEDVVRLIPFYYFKTEDK